MLVEGKAQWDKDGWAIILSGGDPVILQPIAFMCVTYLLSYSMEQDLLESGFQLDSLLYTQTISITLISELRKTAMLPDLSKLNCCLCREFSVLVPTLCTFCSQNRLCVSGHHCRPLRMTPLIIPIVFP